MDSVNFYLALSGALTLLLWVPYIAARMFIWGLPTFLSNYPQDYPKHEPEVPLWVARSQRAHLNMIETLPAFIAVAVAAAALADASQYASLAQWAATFFYARVAHALVYTLGVPFLRTPIYLVSWLSVLMMAWLTVS